MVKKVIEKNPSKSKAKSKAVVVKKPRKTKRDLILQIGDSIVEKCEDDDELLLLDFNGEVAIILKKHSVTVQGIKNPNGMQPYQEPPKEKTFFHTFILQWDGKPLLGNLIDMGVPITWVETPNEALHAIKSA